MRILTWIAGILLVCGTAQAAERPNFLLIVADDATWRDFGFTGNDEIATPNLDRLRSEGMELTRMFTPATTCSPSRHALYTGLYPIRSGAYPNHTRVYDGTNSVFTHLKHAGYRVALQGKEHVGPKASFPYEHLPLTAQKPFAPTKEYLTRDDQPWLLVFASHDPHSPWNRGPQKLYDPAKLTVPEYLHDNETTRKLLADYYAEITQLDQQVGTLMNLLKETEQADNTLVLFVSEQGSSFPYGGKWSLYDNGIRAATIARWPGKIEPGSTSDALMQYVDVAPTLLAAAGVDPQTIDTGCPDANGDGGFDGRNFLNVLTGKTDELRDYVFAQHTTVGINGYEEPYPMRAVRDERYKYIRNLASENRYVIGGIHKGQPIDSWREDAKSDPKLAARVEWLSMRPAEELYDLQKDPNETKNLAGDPAIADVQSRLKQALQNWMQQQGDEGLATEMKAETRQGRGDNTRPVSVSAEPVSVDAAAADRLEKRDQAVLVKDGWIRDPYIVLGPDDKYYLTGTTPLPNDPREQSDPYNTGLKDSSIVGWKMQAWRSDNLVNWESLGTPYTLKDGIWFKTQPQKFKNTPQNQWRLWAPELHDLGDRWAIIHTSPGPANGTNLSVTAGRELAGPFENPLGTEIGRRHDPSLFKDEDGTWWMIYGATEIAPLKPDFSGFAGEAARIGPSGDYARMGHEGCLIRKIGNKYVLFGTGWSTGQMRKGSYNLYYATADKITGPYSERKFAGRFLGHGTPFQDKAGDWWCTAFYNGNVPPLPIEGIQQKDLGETAQTVNEQGVTLVPMEIRQSKNGEILVRALHPAYASPGSDEAQQFE